MSVPKADLTSCGLGRSGKHELKITRAVMRRIVGPSGIAESRMARAAGWSLATPLVTLLASVGVNAVASRTLGPYGFGQFSFATNVFTFLATVMGLGMSVTLVRASRAADSSHAADIEVFSWALVSGIGLLIGILFIPLYHLAPWIQVPGMSAGVGVLLAAAAYGVSLNQMGGAHAQLAYDIRGYFGARAGASVIRLVMLSAVMGFFHSASILLALWAVTIGWLIAGLAWSYRQLLRLTPTNLTRVLTSAPLRSELVGFGVPVLITTLIVAAIQNLDLLIARNALSPQQLGIYSAGLRLTIAQSTLILAASTLALPLAAKAASSGSGGAFLRQVLWAGGLLGILATILLVGLSSPIVRLIYGDQYGDSSAVFVALSLGLILNFVANPASQLLYAHGRPRTILVVNLIQLISLAAGLNYFAEHFGAVGIAVWRSITNTVGALAILWLALSSHQKPSAYGISEAKASTAADNTP